MHHIVFRNSRDEDVERFVPAIHQSQGVSRPKPVQLSQLFRDYGPLGRKLLSFPADPVPQLHIVRQGIHRFRDEQIHILVIYTLDACSHRFLRYIQRPSYSRLAANQLLVGFLRSGRHIGTQRYKRIVFHNRAELLSGNAAN
ncbi:hypothetical protein D3C74_402680 [compost metagenome]